VAEVHGQNFELEFHGALSPTLQPGAHLNVLTSHVLAQNTKISLFADHLNPSFCI
jgi:hypothetical protein